MRRLEERIHVEIAFARGSGPQSTRLVGEAHMEALAVRVGIDGHRGDAEIATGARDAHRDFPSIGDKELSKHLRLFCRERLGRL
jgi:hypothetical protein